LIIIGREIAISALREWMAKVGAGEERRSGFHRQAEDREQMIAIPAAAPL